MTCATSLSRWLYEHDESPKRKHAWGEGSAGFASVRGVLVGKCPAHMGISEAQELLDTALPFSSPRCLTTTRRGCTRFTMAWCTERRAPVPESHTMDSLSIPPGSPKDVPVGC